LLILLLFAYSNEYLVKSDIKLSLTAFSVLGKTLYILFSFVLTYIFEHKESVISIDSVILNSHGLALKAYAEFVKAPTGHKSTILPDISDLNNCLAKVLISVSLPLPRVPKISIPAISEANLKTCTSNTSCHYCTY